MSIGTLIDFAVGYGMVYLDKKVLLKRGQNTVFIIACVIFIYALINITGGSSFLSLFIAGVVIGNGGLRNKEFSANFFEGMSWLMETVLFILLGLEVFLNELPPLFLTGVFITLFLIFIARPAGIFISYLFVPKTSLPKRTFIAWVGLRGATPLVFALIPVVYGIEGSKNILNITFIVVTLSILLQGYSIHFVAKKLNIIEES